MIKLEPCKPEFFDSTRRICLETTRTLKEKEKLLWALYHDYYCKYEPDTCFVAKDKDVVVGYVLCATDFEKYEELFLKHYFETVRAESEEYANAKLKHMTECKKCSKNYPAHLHINITPDYQGKGIGSLLLSALHEKLERIKIPGIFLVTNPKNFNSHKLYIKNGYERIDDLGHGLVFSKKLP